MRVIIISGIPGAGKTTVARMLAARFERAAHIEGDLVGHHFIVSGLVPPQGPPQDEADAQLELRRTNICLLADSFAGAGFLPIIDDVVVAPAVLDGYRRRLKTRPLLLVELVPGWTWCKPVTATATSTCSRSGGTWTRNSRRRCRAWACGSIPRT